MKKVVSAAVAFIFMVTPAFADVFSPPAKDAPFQVRRDWCQAYVEARTATLDLPGLGPDEIDAYKRGEVDVCATDPGLYVQDNPMPR